MLSMVGCWDCFVVILLAMAGKGLVTVEVCYCKIK